MAHQHTMTFPADSEILITRIFDAPVALVWKAHTDAELIPKWWGPRMLTTVVEKLDLTVGGEWRFTQTDPDGNVYKFFGKFTSIIPNERLSYTFEYEGMPGKVLEDIIMFEEMGAQTKITILAVFANQEDRDGMINSGMEWGMREGFEQMDELLALLQ